MTNEDRTLFVLLILDSVLLVILELFFLPLRLDGTVLPDLGAFPLPISAVLAGVTLPMMVKAAARIEPRLAVASAPLLAWLVFVLIAAVPGPGGDVVLIGDWRALLLLAGGGIPGAIALGGVLGKAWTQQPAPVNRGKRAR